MLLPFFYSSYFLLPLLSSYFPTTCLSYTSTNDNPIRLISDRSLHDDLLHDYSSFLSVPVKAIYQFGDSISDTGNLMRSDPSSNCAKLPYGQSFFPKPTGRCSDGLLILDFIAKALKLPLIDPYLNKDGNFTHGVNFAVASATAINAQIMEGKYNVSMAGQTNLSLSVQLSWFKSHLNSYYSNASARRRELAKALFFMGEVGGNDYNFAFGQGKTLQSVFDMVPDVVRVIRNVVEEIIDLGASQIVIPGNFPIGCVPLYLARFKTNDSSMYDEMKCLKEYNKHAEFHNDQIQQMIIELQSGHPNVTIRYMDYFGTLIEILQHGSLLGFDESAMQKACCGVEDNEYGVDTNLCCGDVGVPVCKKPEEYISWDGVHFTQRTYEVMAKKLIVVLSPALQQNVA